MAKYRGFQRYFKHLHQQPNSIYRSFFVSKHLLRTRQAFASAVAPIYSHHDNAPSAV